MRQIYKIGGSVLGLIILGAGIFSGIEYYQYRKSPEYQAMKYLKDLEAQYKNDPYGGNTPEETLQLFIDALKNGDTDLATKYIVMEKQERYLTDLRIIKDNQNLPAYIKLISQARLGKEIYKNHYLMTVTNDNNEEIKSLNFVKNEQAHKWKIEDI